MSTDERLPLLLRVAEESQVAVAFHLEPYPGECIEGNSRCLRSTCLLRASHPSSTLPALPSFVLAAPASWHYAYIAPPLVLLLLLPLRAGRSAHTVREDLLYLMRAAGASPALLRIRGRPLYYV